MLTASVVPRACDVIEGACTICRWRINGYQLLFTVDGRLKPDDIVVEGGITAALVITFKRNFDCNFFAWNHHCFHQQALFK